MGQVPSSCPVTLTDLGSCGQDPKGFNLTAHSPDFGGEQRPNLGRIVLQERLDDCQDLCLLDGLSYRLVVW